MEYIRNTKRDKWTIMMYTSDFNLMTTYAYALRSSNELTSENIDAILLDMEDKGIYRPRNGGSTFTGEFKAIQVAWYMFGYYNKGQRGKKKMVFSPLGNLLLDNLGNSEKVSKIFLTMLFANGFRQPFSRMTEQFNIYAYRLIFALLRDSRLNGRLYNDEVFYMAMFMKEIDEEKYESLVNDILEFRKESPYNKLAKFKENEEVIGLALHEWRYACKILESATIVSINNDHKKRKIGSLEYGFINKKTGRHSAIRTYYEDYIVLKDELISYVDILLEKYPYYAKPFPEDELENRFFNDIVVEMYSFYPAELLSELGMEAEEDQAISKMLSIATDVNYYSHEETEGGIKFEYALKNAFNLFQDVQAERIGGAGNTDIECIYINTRAENKKFDVEAKATKAKLLSINSRRLRTHRLQVNSKYTMIVAPNFSYGVLLDIEGEKSVIIKAATLSNYLYQNIAKYGRNISYSALDEMIEENQGQDISEVVNDYVYNNFGHGANDIRVLSRNYTSNIEL